MGKGRGGKEVGNISLHLTAHTNFAKLNSRKRFPYTEFQKITVLLA
jgi:hypothetical protein